MKPKFPLSVDWFVEPSILTDFSAHFHAGALPNESAVTESNNEDCDIWPEYIPLREDEDNRDQAKQATNSLLEAIENSRSILALEEDWDGEGSAGFMESTWQRAIQFLTNLAIKLPEISGQYILTPFINPGPSGSIDLHWKTDSRELLINIPQDGSQLAAFYGDNFASETIKGTLDTSKDSEWIMLWLMK